MNITLSGGFFGGVVVPKNQFTKNIYEATDKQGVVWVYDLTRSTPKDEATFIGTR